MLGCHHHECESLDFPSTTRDSNKMMLTTTISEFYAFAWLVIDRFYPTRHLIVTPQPNSWCSQGHMKHHGVVTKTRPQARSSRSSTDHLPSSTLMTSPNIPATRSSTGFWNQYQAFLNSNKPNDDPASGSQGESESARSAKAAVRSQMDPRASDEAGGEASGGL